LEQFLEQEKDIFGAIWHKVKSIFEANWSKIKDIFGAMWSKKDIFLM